MDISSALDFVRTRHHGVLVTLKRDGHPQLSNIAYGVDEDGVIRISITDGRAKFANLQRQPWGALHVTRDDFYAYTVIEGDVTLAPVAAAPDDPTVDELVDLYEAVGGTHDDWDEFRAAMVRDHRTVVRLTPTHAYGMLN